MRHVVTQGVAARFPSLPRGKRSPGARNERVIAVLLTCVTAISGQGRPSFDVAAISVRKGLITSSTDPAIHGRTVTARASKLRDLIEYAYALRPEQITGLPNWALSEHYDLDAKADGEGTLTRDQARRMLQSLLADRFQLKVRRETVEVPVYALVLGKSGPKFKPSPEDAIGGYSVRAGEKGIHLEAKKGTMEQLARQLSNTAGRLVVDRTGLSGFYEVNLDWFPADRTPPPDLEVTDMFAALGEQLGLKLEAAKGSIEQLVVEHVEKPSEN